MKFLFLSLRIAFLGVIAATPLAISFQLHAGEKQAIPLERKVIADGNTRWKSVDSITKPVTTSSQSDSLILRWHVSIDYNAADGKAQVGWPRITIPVRGEDEDWSDWDFLHFRIRLDTARSELPDNPVEFLIRQTASKVNDYKAVLSDLEKGEWLEVNLPISSLSHSHEIRGLQFTVFEKNYLDGDQLDFDIDEISLQRYSAPVLLSFSTDDRLSYDDAREIVVSFVLSGVGEGEEKKVLLGLLQEEKTVISGDYTASGGKNRIVLPLGASGIEAGNYQLSVNMDGEPAVRVPIRFIESPWR